MRDLHAGLPEAGLLDRAGRARIADGLVVAVAASLPWSTTATGILVTAWFVTLVSAIDLATLRREVLSPARAAHVLVAVPRRIVVAGEPGNGFRARVLQASGYPFRWPSSGTQAGGGPFDGSSSIVVVSCHSVAPPAVAAMRHARHSGQRITSPKAAFLHFARLHRSDARPTPGHAIAGNSCSRLF